MLDIMEFNRQFFIDLAKDAELNFSHIRQLSEVENHEIVVGDKLLDILIEVQSKVERLEAMGEDEFRAFHVELPRPTPDEWGNCEEFIANGEYKNREEYIEDWESYNPMETYWFHVRVARYNEYRSLIFSNKKFKYFICHYRCLSNDFTSWKIPSYNFKYNL